MRFTLFSLMFIGFTLALAHAEPITADTRALARSNPEYFYNLFSLFDDQVEPIEDGLIRVTGDAVERETHILRFSHHPRVQRLIERLAKYNGTLRILQREGPEPSTETAETEVYFRFNDGVPVIALTQFSHLGFVEHEDAHLTDWIELYEKLKAQGVTPESMTSRMEEIWFTAEFLYRTERRASAQELRNYRFQTQMLGANSLTNDTGYAPHQAVPFFSLHEFIRFSTYAARTVVLNSLTTTPAELNKANLYMDLALRKARRLGTIALRRTGVAHHAIELDTQVISDASWSKARAHRCEQGLRDLLNWRALTL